MANIAAIWKRAEAALRTETPRNLGEAGPSNAFGDPRTNNFSTGGGSFDAANDTGYRSSTAGFNIDSQREMLPAWRREIVKKSRSLRNNLPFYRAIINTAAEHSIGWGLMPMPKSGNKPYDRASLAYWKRWASKKDVDVTGKHDYAGLQMLACKEAQVDGEIFSYKVTDATGRRQRQFFKAEQVGNGLTIGYGPSTSDLTDNWVDGILLDPAMKPILYRVLKRQLPGTAPLANSVMTFEEIPAARMNHIYEREASTRNRGLPWGYSGMNAMLDAMDIQVFEQIAHKLNAAIIASITTPTGASPGGVEGMLAAAAAMNGRPPGDHKKNESVRYLELNGSMIPLFKAGENLSFFGQGRQVVNVVEFATWIFNGVANGYGVPLPMVLGWAGVSGTAVRATNEMAGRFFERVQRMMINDMTQPDWEDVIGTGILAYLYPKDFPMVEPLAPPPGFTGWNSVNWRGPKVITVDKVRDGKMVIELLARGRMSGQEYWAECGEDPDEMPDICDQEVAEGLDRWVNIYKLPEEHYWRRLFGASSMQSGATGSGGGTGDGGSHDAQGLIDQLRSLLLASMD